MVAGGLSLLEKVQRSLIVKFADDRVARWFPDRYSYRRDNNRAPDQNVLPGVSPIKIPGQSGLSTASGIEIMASINAGTDLAP